MEAMLWLLPLTAAAYNLPRHVGHWKRNPGVAAANSKLIMALPAYVPQADIDAISEEAAVTAMSSMQTVSVLPDEAIARGPVDISYLCTAARDAGDAPLLLVHGFDISSLEYRRLLPHLESAGLEAYAPCIPGWGFTDTTNLRTVGVEGKRAALLAFHERVLGGRPAIWVGASLGACIALDCYKAAPSAFAGFVNLDPGFFTDAPPAVPAPIGRLLLQNVLSAPAVRESIAKQAYCVKELQSADAIRVGNLHLRRPAWEDDSLEWLLGGAYGGIAADVPRLAERPCLTLWGREDEVIPPASAVPQLVEALDAAGATRATFRWVETSGHTPHLEQPAVTAAAIVAFVRGDAIGGDGDVSECVAAYKRVQWVKDTAQRAGVLVAGKLGELGEMALAKVKEALDRNRRP